MQKKKYRRRGSPGYHIRMGVYKAVTALDQFFKKSARTLRRLRPAGRVLVFGVGALALTGIILLCTLPGKGKEAGAPAAIRPAGGAIALPEARSAEVNEGAAGVMNLSLEPDSTPPAEITPLPTPSPTPDPTLKRGMEDDPRVAELQQRLMDLGYMADDIPTEKFGPVTEDSLKFFQRQHELQQDGIAGAETLTLIFSAEAKHYTLLEGFSGTDIDNFQRQLKALGYLSKTTGYYGTETIEAVKAFQKQNGLSEDGKAGTKTFDMINSDKAKAHPSVANQARRNANISTMISVAKKQLGDKYVLGAEGPKTFDCSGLVYYCLKEAGSNRRRLNAAGYANVSDWEKITSLSTSKLKKGDLLFFYNNGKTKIGHVGIYIGNGEMVDASSSNGKVVRRSAMTSYWKSHFVCARRPW